MVALSPPAYNQSMYMMAPLERHYDLGFGAVGDSFREAAIEIRKGSHRSALLRHLPETFLLRHAVELYLKSGIIIMHRCLKLPYGTEHFSSEKPLFRTAKGGWKSLFGTHDLVRLYWYWKRLIVDNEERLVALTPHQPDMTVPHELDGWITAVGKIDPSGDYLRYPMSKNTDADKEKSTFKEVTTDDLLLTAKDEYVKALLVENSKGEFLRAFKHDSKTHQEFTKAVTSAADILSNFHAMMRFELTEGW